ncbi:MAG: hypothetical protein JXQ90_20730 [Cyclobacteriaceae bacterium]
MKKATFKKWHLISWEPEILISGGLILTLFNIRPKIVGFYQLMQPYDIPGLLDSLIFVSAVLGSLTVGFSVHLVLRGFWIMYMGVTSYFKVPFDQSLFEFKKVYQKRILNLSISTKSRQLGELSGLVFSITFLFLLIGLGVCLLLFIFKVLGYYLSVPDWVLIILSGFLFIDFLSFGYLKKTRIGVMLYPLLAPLYFLTLSFLYRDLYYYLIQKIDKWKLIVTLMGITLLSVTFGMFNTWELTRRPPIISLPNRYETYDRNYYRDEQDVYSHTLASISSYYQDHDVMKLFVHRTWLTEDFLDNQAFAIRLNNTICAPLSVKNYRGKENQFGYLFMIDISALEKNEEHDITIRVDKEKTAFPAYHDEIYIEIPFVKE